MNMTVAIHPSRLVLLVQIVSRISSGIPKGDQFQLEFLFVPENSLTRVVCTITKSQGFRGRVEDLLIGSDRKLGRGIEDVFRQLETTALKMAESGASQ